MRANPIALMAIALIGLLLMTVITACSVSEEEAEQADIDIAGAPIDVRVTAFRLAEDYEANEVAANQKYDGRVLAVSGTVEAVSGGSGEAYYVDLSAASMSLTSVRCHFSESHLSDITSIRKGDRVTLRGKGDEGKDRDPFTIDVIGCSVIEQALANTPTTADTTRPTPTPQSDPIPVGTVTPVTSASSPASTPGVQQVRAETPTPTLRPTAVQPTEILQTQAATPTPLAEPTPTQTPTPTATPTAIPNAFHTVTGEGTDINFVDLPAGQWVVQADLSNNTDNDLIQIQVGGDYVMSVFDHSWSGRSLINVGTEYFEIPPGRTPIEADAAQGASWTITFVDPPPASDPAEPISGQGQDVKFVNLSEGEWVVEIEVSGNEGPLFFTENFDVDIGGKNVVYESGHTWSGRKLVTVGNAYDEIPPGRTGIEVEAESGATWTLTFTQASSLTVMDFLESVTGEGTDVKFVDLPAGQWVVQADLSNNTDNDLIQIQVGGDYVMSVFDQSWSGRSLINVGTEYFEIPPGRTPIEADAAQGASWTITFVDPPVASDPAEPISGQGQDVKFVNLSEGEWVVEIEVSGNEGPLFFTENFDVDIGGKNVVYESGHTWSGRKLVTVGNAYDEIPPGRTGVEVEAESGATWTLRFIRP